VSEKNNVSIFRVEEQAKQETSNKQTTSNVSVCSVLLPNYMAICIVTAVATSNPI
jgi:hypothetical protein